MKNTEAERLANVILESSKGRTVVSETPAPKTNATKADEEKLLQARRKFDKKYNIFTPHELMKI